MIPARNVPSYVQGYRFSDDPYFYDADRQAFRDMAGYGERAELLIDVGSPIFETVDGYRCLKLDNTFHGGGIMPIPWHGSLVVVCKPVYAGGGATLSKFILLFGDSTNPSTSGGFWLTHAEGNRRLLFTSPSAQLSQPDVVNNDSLRVAGFALDQETRQAYATKDGITVATSTPLATNAHSGSSVGANASLRGFRFGNLSGTASDTDASTNMYLYMHELHFFSENIWTKYPTEAAAMMSRLRLEYGV